MEAELEDCGMPRARGKLIAQGMLRQNTPVDDYRDEYGLWVKREDLSCLPPGPAFSKTRGVYARVASRKESVIGVLDTCLLYTSPSPRDRQKSRMPSSA